MDGLAAARAAREDAVDREEAALAALRAAGIQARLAIDEMVEEMGGTLGSIAQKNRLPASALSKLNPRKDGGWEPLRIDSYRTIDKITDGQYRLAELRQALDEAKRQVPRAQRAVSRVEARMDAARPHTAETREQDNTLVIDDVLIHQELDRVVLDIRVRNAGEQVANITRVAVKIVTREEFLTAYAPTAHYDLLVDGDINEVGVAHLIKPQDVDSFTLVLGFAEHELGCAFTAVLELRYNRDHVVSKLVNFNSCFE